jgi:SIR2-like domain
MSTKSGLPINSPILLDAKIVGTKTKLYQPMTVGTKMFFELADEGVNRSKPPTGKVALIGAGFSVSNGIPASKAMFHRLKTLSYQPVFHSSIIPSEVIRDCERILATMNWPINIETFFLILRYLTYHFGVQGLAERILDKKIVSSISSLKLFEKYLGQDMQLVNDAHSIWTYFFNNFICMLRVKKLDEYITKYCNYFNKNEFHIITLNYDRLIEIGFQSLLINYSIGFSQRNIDPFFENDRIKIVKIHGSLEWKWAGLDSFSPQPSIYSNHMPWLEPAIIFGITEKAQQSRQFPLLLEESRNEIQHAEEMLIVGYSFSDPHINDAIQFSIKSKSLQKIIIVDPGLNKDKILDLENRIPELSGINVQYKKETAEKFSFQLKK